MLYNEVVQFSIIQTAWPRKFTAPQGQVSPPKQGDEGAVMEGRGDIRYGTPRHIQGPMLSLIDHATLGLINTTDKVFIY